MITATSYTLKILTVAAIMMFAGIAYALDVNLVLPNADAAGQNPPNVNQENLTGPAPPRDENDVAPDSTPDLNTLNPTHPMYKQAKEAKYPPVRRSFGDPTPGQADFASRVNKTLTNVSGVYAGLQPHQTLSLGVGQVLYAPALQPANNGPLEVVTTYARPSLFSGTEHAFKIWDHSSSPPRFVLSKNFDTTFYNNYVLVENGKDVYYAIVEKVSNTWRVLLFNKATATWEVQYTSTASSTIPHGWMSWESTFNGACPSLPSIQGKNFLVKDNGVWKSVTSTYAGQYKTMNCPYPTTWVSQFSNWIVG